MTRARPILHRSRAAADASAAHQVILVREQDAQHSGSGCCGRLGDQDRVAGRRGDFYYSRQRMQRIGAIYRALAERAPRAELVVADPRNVVWLYPAVWRAARSRGFRVGAALRAVVRAGAPVAVVVDGETLFSGRLPAVETVVDAVIARLGQRFPA